MKSKLLHIFALLLDFELGGIIYYIIEILYRGYSHDSMFIVGGICLIAIGLINEIYRYDMYIELQILIGDIIVLAIEFTSGVILNIILKLNVWDYSDMPGNILGQICPQFAILWIPIVAFAIWFDDFIKYNYFTEYKKPRYRSFILELFKR